MSRSWLWIGIASCLFCMGYWACVIGDLPRENLRCFNGQCLAGFRCDFQTQKCVPSDGEGTAVTDGPKDETVTPEEGGSTGQETPPEPTGQDDKSDGGVKEDPPKDEPPADQPPVAQCPYRKAAKAELCPIPQGDTNSCEQLGKTFQLGNEELPETLADATAISNGGDWNLRFASAPKVYIHLIGGQAAGKASNKVYYSQVALDGKLTAWKATEAFKDARYKASAFLINGYLYVMGGLADGDKAVESIERAKLKDDGSLEAFETIGTWAGANAMAGYAYRYGYFYRVGGQDAQGKLVTKAERVLLLPDGKTLGKSEALPDLPEGRTGPLLSTTHNLYLLGPNGSRKALVARLQPDGTVEGWCQNTDLPKEAKSFTAIADARRLLLVGVQKTNDQLEKNIFLAPLFSSIDPLGNPYGGGVDNWRCTRSDKLNGQLVTPRHRAAVAVAFNFMFVLGGVDSGGKPLKSVEQAALAYREAGCDVDRDLTPNNFDFCPNTYATGNKNSDQPSKVKRPGSDGYIERFGPGDACESTNMMLVPAGEFTRGADQSADEPIKKIGLSGFYIDKNEVTNKDYTECVTQGKCTAPAKTTSATRGKYYDDPKFENFPVVNITWEQAKAYCEFRGKRLPTEAEWEKAARGLERNVYPWGDAQPTCDEAQSKDCKEKDTLEVGKRPKGDSPYKISDMAGNVREWVADYYKSDYYKDSPNTDPKGPGQGTDRVVRGGSFLSGPSALRASARDKLKPTDTADDVGFRCAQSLFLPPSSSD